MTKLLTISLILLSSLHAGSPTQSEQNGIYMEAVLFIAVFGVMGIVSYIYSKKHAKEYKPKKEVIEEKSPYADRIAELSEMREKGLLSEKEFELLNNYYLS
ncbi:MAG: hypothetical protein U9O83_01580 [Campylobacterota bacterium]|nr:hypothetical protein [Campylobacterota bacterium]